MKENFKYSILVLFFLLLFLLDILLGAMPIQLSNFFEFLYSPFEQTSTNFILLNFRIPKALTAIFVGIALSVSGLLMQTSFRNPLADPYILGVSSGAGLGVAILVLGFGFFGISDFSTFSGHYSIAFAAWIGAAFVLALILFISIKIRSLMTVLILGIFIAGIISAVVTILQYFSNESMLKAFIIWTMGSLSGVTKTQLWVMIPAIVLGFFMAFFSSKLLDGLLLGEDYAKSLGINLIASRVLIFTSTSILAGTVTAFCGPIGFIGIVSPHLARMYIKKSNHQKIILASALIGANMMLFSDLVTNLPQNQILPINSVTSLLGIPIIMWIILKNKTIAM